MIGLVIPTVSIFSARPADSSFANAKTHHAIILTIALSDDISPRCCFLFISLCSCNLLFLNEIQSERMKISILNTDGIFGYETFIRLVSSTLFGIPFHLPVPLYNSGSISLFIIFKRLVQKDFNIISASFQKNLLWFLHEKECSVYTNLFCISEMRWMFISSTALWVTSADTNSVASRLRSKLARS